LYVFSFNRFAWFDRIFKINITKDFDVWLKKILVLGNLIKYYDDIFLCLWNEISFAEQYTYVYDLYKDKIWFELLCDNFLTKKNISIVNRMVYERYSTYKSVLRYFVSFDIDGLMNKWKIQKKKTKIQNNEIFIINWNFEISDNILDGQQLIIFPDLWTLFNTVDESILNSKWNVFLNSNDTQNQKDKKRRMIKNWEIKNVFCTHWEMFQDRNDLKKIILIDPYKRYYENQQDPRYSVEKVVKKMWEVYLSQIEIG